MAKKTEERKYREKEEGESADREERENIKQKLQDPGRAMERVLNPAVSGLRGVEEEHELQSSE